jgi:hypothetical protein
MKSTEQLLASLFVFSSVGISGCASVNNGIHIFADAMAAEAAGGQMYYTPPPPTNPALLPAYLAVYPLSYVNPPDYGTGTPSSGKQPNDGKHSMGKCLSCN